MHRCIRQLSRALPGFFQWLPRVITDMDADSSEALPQGLPTVGIMSKIRARPLGKQSARDHRRRREEPQAAAQRGLSISLLIRSYSGCAPN